MRSMGIKNKDLVGHAVIKECKMAMAPAILFYFFKELVGGFLNIFTATVLGKFTDAVFSLNFSFGIYFLIELLLCMAAMILVLPAIETIGEIVVFSRSLKYSCAVLKRYFQKKYHDVQKMEEGEVSCRLEDDTIEFYQHYVNICVKLLTAPLICLYLIYHAANISILFTIIVFVFSIIKILLPMMFKEKNTYYDKKKREYTTNIYVNENELLKNTYMNVLLGVKKRWIEKMDKLFQSYYETIYQKNVFFKAVSENLISFMDTFCMVMIMFIGAVMIAKGLISTGNVVAMIGFFPVFTLIEQNLMACIQEIPQFENVLERMKVLYTGHEQTYEKKSDTFEKIKIKDLQYQYNGKRVLKGISFGIESNCKIALMGENGSGKTTLLNILSGALVDYKGSILIDSVELKELNKEWWRTQVAYVTQDPFLFKGTVRENVKLGNLSASIEQIEKVMDKIGILYLADRNIDIEKNDLSGGERQKISIARALLKDSAILLLDEPSNHLDSYTKKWLIEWLRKSDKIVIFTSHDKDLLQISDMQIKL